MDQYFGDGEIDIKKIRELWIATEEGTRIGEARGILAGKKRLETDDDLKNLQLYLDTALFSIGFRAGVVEMNRNENIEYVRCHTAQLAKEAELCGAIAHYLLRLHR